MQDADLGVSKVVDNATPNEGDTIQYTVTINNNGPDDATTVSVTDLLPAGVTHISNTPSGITTYDKYTKDLTCQRTRMQNNGDFCV